MQRCATGDSQRADADSGHTDGDGGIPLHLPQHVRVAGRMLCDAGNQRRVPQPREPRVQLATAGDDRDSEFSI